MVSRRAAAWGLVLAAAATSAPAQQQPPQRPQARAVPGGGAAALPANLLEAAAQSVGVRQCLPGVGRLSSLSIQGSKSHEVIVDRDPSQPDKSPFFGAVGMQYEGSAAMATVAAVPDPRGGCTLMAERIVSAPEVCTALAARELKGYTRMQLLPNFAVYTSPTDPGSTVSLLDAPPSCLVVRRYVKYRWQVPPG